MRKMHGMQQKWLKDWSREALMQDAHVMTWRRVPAVAAETLESIAKLNHRFLDLVALHPGGWNVPGQGLAVPLSVQIAPLSETQKSAAANCPYALFDLRFHDDVHWRTRLEALPANVADAAPYDAKSVEFVRLALFFAWHLASTNRLAAQLLLGMQEFTVAAFQAATVDCLPALAVTEACHLTARWNHCAAYWRALTGAACGPNLASLRRIQLHGLQLAAAARLR
jgi:hypothetical protein